MHSAPGRHVGIGYSSGQNGGDGVIIFDNVTFTAAKDRSNIGANFMIFNFWISIYCMQQLSSKIVCLFDEFNPFFNLKRIMA